MTDPARVHRFACDSFASAAAGLLGEFVEQVSGAREHCRLGLAGGSTPIPVYRELTKVPCSWQTVRFFWGDERAVPPDSDDSNYKNALRHLLSPLGTDPAHVFGIRGELGATEAARRYEAVLGAEPLDILLLGIGDDGHTASLFPGGPELDERQLKVCATHSPKPPHDRVSLSLPAINAARLVVFLVTGSSKRQILSRVLDADANPDLPAARVRPTSGQLVFLIDEAAAT